MPILEFSVLGVYFLFLQRTKIRQHRLSFCFACRAALLLWSQQRAWRKRKNKNSMRYTWFIRTEMLICMFDLFLFSFFLRNCRRSGSSTMEDPLVYGRNHVTPASKVDPGTTSRDNPKVRGFLFDMLWLTRILSFSLFFHSYIPPPNFTFPIGMLTFNRKRCLSLYFFFFF